jgi:hypothetical protein
VIRKRLDGFSEVVQCWDGPVVCIAGGPSLTQEQCEAVRSKARVIVVNDAFKLAPWADALYFADHRWMEWHRKEVSEFAGHKVSIEQSRPVEWPDDIHILRNLDKGDPTGLSLDPMGLKTGRHSGYQALNLAVLAGGNPILLLGYDYKFVDGKAHFHGDHPIPTPENHLTGFRQKLSTIENPLKDMGIEVFNCSPDSLLEAFPRMSLEKALLHTLPTTRVAA